MRGHFKTAGDLVTTAKTYPFTTEVKREQNWSMREYLAGRRSPVWKWWRQVQKAALEEEREPMLWFRKNNQPWRVIVRWEFVDGFERLHARARVLPPVRAYVWTAVSTRTVDEAAQAAQMWATDLLALDPRIIVRVAKELS